MIAFVFLFALFSSAVGFSFGQKGSAAINVRGEMTALKVRDGYFYVQLSFLFFGYLVCSLTPFDVLYLALPFTRDCFRRVWNCPLYLTIIRLWNLIWVNKLYVFITTNIMLNMSPLPMPW